MFILSTYEVLDEFAEELKMPTKQFQNLIKAKRFKFIDDVIIKLIAFIKQCSIDKIEGENLPNAKKQYVMKDLKICDKLFAILKRMGKKILE